MLTDWPRSLTALVAPSTSSMDMPATKRLERRLPMEVFSAIARMDLLSDNQMKKARSKLTFVPQDWPSRHPRFAQTHNRKRAEARTGFTSAQKAVPPRFARDVNN